MDWVVLFKKVAFGAGEAAIDTSGNLLLPGAWPILRAAYQPVMDGLKTRLGIVDSKPSPQQIEKLVAAFEADQTLQNAFRSSVLDQLGDIQTLKEIIAGDSEKLTTLLAGTDQIRADLKTGIEVSDDAAAKIADEIERARRMRALAEQETLLGAELVMRQVSRLQVRADELLEEGAPDRAADELKEGVLLLSLLLARAPTDMNLQLQLGFIYKTIAQLFESIANPTEAAEYVNRADEVFRIVKAGVASGEASGLQVANAMHGMCNLRHAKHDLAGAIACYEQVVDLCPIHSYAWHDMFLAQYEFAQQGHPADLLAMRRALDKVIETGAGMPGLGANKIKTMEGMLREVEAACVASRPPGQTKARAAP